MTSEAQALAPSPCLSQHISVYCQGVWVTLCFAFQKLVAALSSEALKLCTCPVRGSFLLYNHSSLPGAQVLSPLLSLSLSFFFHPNWLCGGFLALSEVWGLLPVFSRCSMQTVWHIGVFWTYLWEEVSSMSYSSAILIPSSHKAYFKALFFLPNSLFLPLECVPNWFLLRCHQCTVHLIMSWRPPPLVVTEAEPRFEGLKTGDQS